MNFVLYSNLFDFILLIVYFINITIIGILSFKEIKNRMSYKNIDLKKEEISHKGIYAFTMITVALYGLIFMLLIIHLAYKYNFISVFSLLFYLSFLWGTIKNRNKNVKSLSYENKADYVNIILLYLLFFSCNATSVYINSFSTIPHIAKEYLLLIFLIIKLVFFAYCIIINISIFLSNIALIFNKKGKQIIETIRKKIYKPFGFKFYSFNLSINKKNTNYIVLDIPIFFITCPFFLLYDLVMPLLLAFARWTFKKSSSLIKMIDSSLSNSSMVISKALKISSIISLVIVHWIMIYSSNIISSQTKDFFNLIITVILIPLIYDGIKQNDHLQQSLPLPTDVNNY